MSHGRYNASSEVAHLVAEVRNLTPEQNLEIHGIEINSDKTIYDTAYNQKFKNITEWAKFVIAQEMNEEGEDDYNTGKWDDED